MRCGSFCFGFAGVHAFARYRTDLGLVPLYCGRFPRGVCLTVFCNHHENSFGAGSGLDFRVPSCSGHVSSGLQVQPAPVRAEYTIAVGAPKSLLKNSHLLPLV